MKIHHSYVADLKFHDISIPMKKYHTHHIEKNCPRKLHLTFEGRTKKRRI